MGQLPIRQFFKRAIVSSPIIALLIITPIFVVSRVNYIYFPLAILVVSLLTFVIWLINIALLYFINRSWMRQWPRVLMSSMIMSAILFSLSPIIDPPFARDVPHFDLMRIINIVGVNSIIFIITDLMIINQEKRKLDADFADLKMVNLEVKYKLLKEKINPHFIFNALSTINSLVKFNPDLAREYIVRLSDFLRMNIKEGQELVPVGEELELSENYLSLQKIRFANAIQYECSFENQHKGTLPFFSIVPLLENAIKHNAFTVESPLRIRIICDGDFIMVSNNIQQKAIYETTTGTGLQNLDDRCRLLTGYPVLIEKNKEEFCVKLQIKRA